MSSSLRRRVKRLSGDLESAGVLAALAILRDGGTPPPGRACDRALELWEEAERRGCDHPHTRWLRCYCIVTGKGLAELIADAEVMAGADLREEDKANPNQGSEWDNIPDNDPDPDPEEETR